MRIFLSGYKRFKRKCTVRRIGTMNPTRVSASSGATSDARPRGGCYFLSCAKESSQRSALSFVLYYRHIKVANETDSKAVIGTHSSGGIIALFAEMQLWEYRFAAVCAFEDGKVRKMGLAFSYMEYKDGCSSWNSNEEPRPQGWFPSKFLLRSSSANHKFGERTSIGFTSTASP